MKWFKSSKEKVDKRTLSFWIFSLRSDRDVANMRSMRKQVQGGMINEIGTHLIPINLQSDGQAAYLLVHFLSGRSKLPIFADALEVDPTATKRASSVYEKVRTDGLPSEQFELTCVYNCCLEIANETVERHYREALILANHGIELWPAHGELWRQRGVVKLALGDYAGALMDLERAQAENPSLNLLMEPLEAARRLANG